MNGTYFFILGVGCTIAALFFFKWCEWYAKNRRYSIKIENTELSKQFFDKFYRTSSNMFFQYYKTELTVDYNDITNKFKITNIKREHLDW